MDQLKEILRQAIKYRFWIAVGISTLLPVVAYLVGSGAIRDRTATETAKIQDAKKKADVYASGVVPNRQYPPLVAEKTAVVSKDVTGAWKKLYARQAPLLTWPERVETRFRTWGRTWPEKEDASTVQVAIIEYVTDYPTYVDQVYQSFHPFDPITGEGVVAAPPKELLLRPAPFKVESLPDLGKVWGAQERLWTQRTLLEIIADVNKNAKSWDTAVVRQINRLEVGNALAQDQKSLASGDTVVEAPPITDPKAPPPPETTAAEAAPGMTTMPGMSGLGGQNEKPDAVYYLKNDTITDTSPYKVLPVQMSVLVEQDHIQDFLCAIENSPMSIQLMEFELAKPGAKVVKPEKGENMSFGGYGGGNMNPMAAMMQRMQGAPGLAGFGGRAMQSGSSMYGQMSSMPGRGGDNAASKKSGVDVRGKDRAKERADREKAEGKSDLKSAHDPYYNIVEITVYGQARFYNPPPAEPAVEPSTAETATAVTTPAADAKSTPDTGKAETEATKTDAEKDKTEDAKPETAKAKGAADVPADDKSKSEAPADAPQEKPEATKTEPAAPAPKK